MLEIDFLEEELFLILTLIDFIYFLFYYLPDIIRLGS